MIFPKAKKIARDLNWRKTKNSVFGLYKNYFFIIGDAGPLSNPQFKYVLTTTGPISDEQLTGIKTELEANKKLLKFSIFKVEDNSVFIQFNESLTFTKLRTVYTMMDFLVELFKKINITEQERCRNCGTKENIRYYDLNDNGAILCNSCFHEIDTAYTSIEKEILSKEKNYAAGFLGSLVFSIPGIIGWVLLAVYLERVASVMALVIAFLGFKGFIYFKGQILGKWTTYLLVVSNIICILIANAATILALFMKEGSTFDQAFTALQNSQIVKDTFYDNIMASFGIALFVWIWIFFAFKTKKLKIKLADN